MADFTKATGTTGTLMIRDTGSVVEFWVNAGQGSTNIGTPGATFWYDGPGTNRVDGNWSYPAGSGWRKIASYNPGNSSGSVSFGIGATGTSGFGGPTSFSASISRATAPAVPTSKVPTNITHTGMTFEFDDGSNGGSAITKRWYQVSTSSSFSGASSVAAPSNGIVTRTDLSPGNTYYWRAKTENAIGQSGWSTVRSAKTLPPLYRKVSGVWKEGVPYVKVSGVWKPAVAYLKKAGAWVISQ